MESNQNLVENDCDFIRGLISLEHNPPFDPTYFIVIKGEERRRFSVEKYFDLELRNWELDIDKANTKREKILIANKAIFSYRQNLLNKTSSLIESVINKNIEYLKYAIEYINVVYDDTVLTKTKEVNVPSTIKLLSDLFINKKDFTKAIEALRTIKVIDSNNSNLIGSKLKGVMQVWIDLLKKRQKLKIIPDKELPALLNKHFKNLRLGEKGDGKHFRNPINKTAQNRYGTRLSELL
jgi:hypothetical protein